MCLLRLLQTGPWGRLMEVQVKDVLNMQSKVLWTNLNSEALSCRV